MILIPTLPLRKRISKEKKKELNLVNRAINNDNSALKESRLSGEYERLNLPDLLSYRKVISSTKEIPVNIPVIFRLLFYVLLPLMTWTAASIVDKIVVAILKF